MTTTVAFSQPGMRTRSHRHRADADAPVMTRTQAEDAYMREVRANEKLREQLRQANARVQQLEADLAAAQAGAIAAAPRWCTPAEAARHLGKHVSSINRALHDGRLNGTQGSNGQWRVALPLPPALPTRTRGRKRKTL